MVLRVTFGAVIAGPKVRAAASTVASTAATVGEVVGVFSPIAAGTVPRIGGVGAGGGA